MESSKQAMMGNVYILGDYILSPLGSGSGTNFEQVRAGISGIQHIQNETLLSQPFYASLINDDESWYTGIKNASRYTRLEKLIILCLQALFRENNLYPDRKTLVVLSTTKGNISLLKHPDAALFPKARIYLSEMAAAIQHYFGIGNEITLISNACISGSLAVSVAGRLLQDNRFDKAIVIAGDEISRFILSGFASFQALSNEPCRPFDRDRNGVNLGEAIAAVYLSKTPANGAISLCATSSCNDANHISGPSRTGEGLYRSISSALNTAATPVDFISAHGTATLYNDEMESVALYRSGLNHLPLHSLKGYYGHTLGASGLLETILGIHFLKNNLLPKTYGYQNPGTSYPLNLSTAHNGPPLRSFLKLASGFGGCNIASVFQKL